MRLKAKSNILADGPTELKAGDVFEVEDVAGKALIAATAAEVTNDPVTVKVGKVVNKKLSEEAARRRARANEARRRAFSST